jgi:hypothetical protein
MVHWENLLVYKDFPAESQIMFLKTHFSKKAGFYRYRCTIFIQESAPAPNGWLHEWDFSKFRKHSAFYVFKRLTITHLPNLSRGSSGKTADIEVPVYVCKFR